MNLPYKRIIKESAKVEATRNYRHVALVFRGSNLLAIGTNITRHAEVCALQKLFPSERRGTTVVSLRIGKTGNFTQGKPCQKCQQYLEANGVKKVVWSNPDGSLTRERIRYGSRDF